MVIVVLFCIDYYSICINFFYLLVIRDFDYWLIGLIKVIWVYFFLDNLLYGEMIKKLICMINDF